MDSISESTTFAQASTLPGWQKAMQEEIAALEHNHTWGQVDFPPCKKSLPCK